MNELLNVRIAGKRYGEKKVLRDVAFDVRAGEIAALVGPSGCGKSTLLRIVAGLESDYEGAIRLAGKILVGRSPDIGFVFQEPRLLPWLNVMDNVVFGDSGASDARVRADDLLVEVGLAGYQQALPKQLSGGQAQRVAIARGLFTRPRLLLLDEPFSAVDAFTRMHLQELLLRLAAEHRITVLLVTHDVDEAAYLANRVVVLGNGEVVDDLLIDPALPPPSKRDRRSQTLVSARDRILTALEALHVI
jgi:sulfonate transport system ATP-binding protein